MTTLTPRDYQKTAVDTITAAHLNSTSRIVLAAATGSGKTEMAIMIIENFIKSGLGRVLVIAHHTNIIKSNFIDRLNDIKPGFTFSDTNQSVDCFIAIRSTSLDQVDTSQFGLLIVDEAHQNYFASTCQVIANNFNHQVLLTATPSKFVRAGGFDILPIARLDIPNEYFASLSFRVVNAETAITDDSYNANNTIKSAVKFHRAEVKSMVDSVVPFLDDNKKLFICKDITQAKATALYLTSIGIPTSVSDSKSDSDNDIAESFKSGDINSLCVVDRMRVGYSDNDLYHTIDMSFTHNPDVIMQILSRSNRGNQSQSKQYIKITNNNLNLRTRMMLSIALALFKSNNLVSFDGTFASVQVPVVKNSGATRIASGVPSDNWFIPDTVDVVNYFDNCDFVDANTVLIRLNFRATNYITYDYCVDLIKSNGYTHYNQFRVAHRGPDHFLMSNNLIDKICTETFIIAPTKRNKKSISIDDIIKIATNYSTVSEFRSKHKSFYKVIKSENKIDLLIGSDGLPLNKKSGFKVAKYEKVCVICSTNYFAKVKTSQVCSKACKYKRDNSK